MKLKLYFALIVITVCGFGCSDKETTTDPNTGRVIELTCQIPFSIDDSYRGEVSLEKEANYITINTSVENGSKRIVRLYNETSCASMRETDYFDVTDVNVTQSRLALDTLGKGLGLYVIKGANRVRFTVDECDEIILEGNYSCKNLINTDSGYFIINVM